MTHPGLTSTRLAEMRRVLDEVPLSDRDRRAVEIAIADIETEWKDRHRGQYEKAVETRDGQHDEVINVAEQFRQLLAEATEDVRRGRRTAKDVRSWLRDVRADFDRLTQQHQGVESTEDQLAAFEAMDPDEFQAQHFTRIPLIEQGAPTLIAKIADHTQAQNDRLRARQAPRVSREQIDADQEALVRELGRRMPAMTNPDGPRR